jgi:hypothetical protein
VSVFKGIIDMNDKNYKTVDRRTFLKAGGTLTFGALVAGLLFRRPLLTSARAEVILPDYTSIKDACYTIETEEERIVAAIVDTVVPGADADPTGAPGALDACAMNLVYNAFFPFMEYLPVIVGGVTGLADQEYGKSFMDCTLEERTGVLKKFEEVLPITRLAYRFIRSAFYGAAYNMVGTNYLNWPGPNLGYIDHEDFSFREPVSDELTEEGNLP